jgi:hypothetical protein
VLRSYCRRIPSAGVKTDMPWQLFLLQNNKNSFCNTTLLTVFSPILNYFSSLNEWLFPRLCRLKIFLYVWNLRICGLIIFKLCNAFSGGIWGSTPPHPLIRLFLRDGARGISPKWKLSPSTMHLVCKETPWGYIVPYLLYMGWPRVKLHPIKQ